MEKKWFWKSIRHIKYKIISYKSTTWSLSTWTLTPPMLPFLKDASMSRMGLKRLPLSRKRCDYSTSYKQNQVKANWRASYLMLSSLIRTRKRGRPGIFQHCLINCKAFCKTHVNTTALMQAQCRQQEKHSVTLRLTLMIYGECFCPLPIAHFLP